MSATASRRPAHRAPETLGGVTLLSARDAATYAGVKPATLRVWKLRYGLRTWRGPGGETQYDLGELAGVLARRSE